MFIDMKFILFSLIYIAFHFQLNAQDSLSKAKRMDSTIWVRTVNQGLFTKTYLVRADKSPLKHSEVKRMLLSYELSATEYKKYQRATISVFVWAAIAVSSLVISRNDYNRNNTGPSIALMCVGFGSLAMEIISSVNSHKHFNRALRLYNSHYKL